MRDQSFDEILSQSPAFAAAARRFKLRIIWSVLAGVSTVAGLVPLAHFLSSKLFEVFPRVPLWAWQWTFVVGAVVIMWWALSIPSIAMGRLFPPRERRFLEVDVATGIAVNELRIWGVRRPRFNPPKGRLMVEVTDRPDALHGYRYDPERGVFTPAAAPAQHSAGVGPPTHTGTTPSGRV